VDRAADACGPWVGQREDPRAWQGAANGESQGTPPSCNSSGTAGWDPAANGGASAGAGTQDSGVSTGATDGRDALHAPHHVPAVDRSAEHPRGKGKGSEYADGGVMEHAKGAHGKGYGKGGKGGKGNKGGVVDSMSTYRVRLHKPDVAARLGITLVGQADAPCITALAHGCIAANSGMLLVGQKLYAVNGVAVQEHESATKMLRAAVRTVELTVSRSDAFAPLPPSAATPHTGGAAGGSVCSSAHVATRRADVRDEGDLALREELRKLREENKKLKEESSKMQRDEHATGVSAAPTVAIPEAKAKGGGKGGKGAETVAKGAEPTSKGGKGGSAVAVVAKGGAGKGGSAINGASDRTEWQEWLHLADMTAQDEARRRRDELPHPLPQPAAKLAVSSPPAAATPAEPGKGKGKPARPAKGSAKGAGSVAVQTDLPTTMTVKVHKPDKHARLGITLRGSTGSAPTILALAPGCIAANSGVVSVGQLLYAVDGQAAEGHEQGTQLLKAASGDVRLTLSSIAYSVSEPASPSATSTTPPYSPVSPPVPSASGGGQDSKTAATFSRAHAKEARRVAAPAASATTGPEVSPVGNEERAAHEAGGDSLAESLLRKVDDDSDEGDEARCAELEDPAEHGPAARSLGPAAVGIQLSVGSDVALKVRPTSHCSVRLSIALFGTPLAAV